jgi:biotin carboxylase
MDKTVMIIGAGFGQLPAILKAKEMGITVVVIDKDTNALGKQYADYFYTIDVLDVQGAIEIAKKHVIDGVMTMQTDLPVPTVGAIIDELGLKGSGLEIAERCSDKIFTRKAFKAKGVPQPDFGVVSSYEEAKKEAEKIGFPCVIKAPDSSGSRGVTKVNSFADINNAVDEAFKYSRQPQILVEEFISGLEIGAQGFSVAGKCVEALVHNDTLSEPPYMVPTGHSFPINMTKHEEEEVQIAVKNAVDALGVTDGPTNVDLILDKDNKPMIIEIGARIGATCLPELVYYFTGINWIEQALNACLNLEINIKAIKSQPVTAYVLQSPKDGILKSFNIPEEVEQHPQVMEVEVTAKIGEEVNMFRKGTDRIGKIVVIADSVKEADDLALSFMDKIKFYVE